MPSSAAASAAAASAAAAASSAGSSALFATRGALACHAQGPRAVSGGLTASPSGELRAGAASVERG